MYFIKPPKIVKNFYKNFIWDIPVKEKKVFLTFDDCSDECLTYEVEEILTNYGIKASFFCIGKYIEYNKLQKFLFDKGHIVGNHGYLHLNGFRTNVNEYVQNVFRNYQIIESDLFRPPYGKINYRQSRILLQSFKIIMWSLMPYDFDEFTTQAECLRNVISNVYPGAIIVFHTNKKARKNLLYTLPASIEFLLKNSYKFGTIDSDLI
jgi:peptidoglycan/xylan/chitin deacetylase (PgdA/CDA1 family)